MASTDLVLDIVSEGARVVVSAHGEIDLGNAERLRDAVKQSVGGVITALFLDCRGVSFIDSTGIRMLLDARELCVENGINFEMAPSDRVRKVAETLGVAEALGFDATPDA